MNRKILDIAHTLETSFLDPLQASNDISLFLCGGSTAAETKFRRKVGDYISKMKSNYRYPVYYTEEMFMEQILGHQKQDLLSLENLLADSVHCVVILLQSPGTFTELGAFANHEKLSDKLVVVIEPRYRRKPSFINRGPLRYLKSKTKSRILYSSMDEGNLNTLAREIAEVAREIARHSSPTATLSNPISSYELHLSLIYVFDPIPVRSLFDIVDCLAPDEQATAVTAAYTVVNNLISERKVAGVSGELSITPKGSDSLIYNNRTKRGARSTLKFLSGLRLEALNLTLRRDFGRVWAERCDLSRVGA